MNRPTVSSTVTHGKFNRDPRKAQPLPTESSAVAPTVSSPVTTGKFSREPRFNFPCRVSFSVFFPVGLRTFQGVLQFVIQRDMQLVGGCRRSLAPDSVALRSQKLKSSRGLMV